ncbi:UNVERIFIED_CONTAM: E3 ubiquitin-protein ligase rad18 [Siphonaria sp. JEL0065]|nr:E3 ubiquitin-protein ligase rad18 [Siphonaria sp. JEL0065]
MVDVRFCMVLDALAESLRKSRTAVLKALDTKESGKQHQSVAVPSTTKPSKKGKEKTTLEENEIKSDPRKSKRKEIVCTSSTKPPSKKARLENSGDFSSLCKAQIGSVLDPPPAAGPSGLFGDGETILSFLAEELTKTPPADAFFECPICNHQIRNRYMDAHISSDCKNHIEKNLPPPQQQPSTPFQNQEPIYINEDSMDDEVEDFDAFAMVTTLPKATLKKKKSILIFASSSPELIKIGKDGSCNDEAEDDIIIDDSDLVTVHARPIKPAGLTTTVSNISHDDLDTTDEEEEEEEEEKKDEPDLSASGVKKKRVESIASTTLVQLEEDHENDTEESTTSTATASSGGDSTAVDPSSSFLGLDSDQKRVTRNAILANIMPSSKKSSTLTKDPRRHRPGIAYDTLKDAQLRKLLKDDNLPSTGDKFLLKRRHKEYILLHNANLDSLNPVPQTEILAKMALWEQTHGGLSGGRGTVAASMSSVAAFQKHAVTSAGEEKNRTHMEKYADEFRALIEGVKERRRIRRQQAEEEKRKTKGKESIDKE